MSDVLSVQAPAAATSDPLLESAVRKATRRLAWFVVLIYFVAVLDRVNIGFAALTMNRAIGLSAAAFGFGASLFLVGYILFEIPSNLALQRFGARRWLARIAVTWGLMTALMALAQGETSFLGIRFLIGAAEAGSLPGIMLYLTYWFPKAHRARLNALFLLSIPLSNAVSAPLAAGLMSLDGWLSLAGWQWLFILEGIISVAVGIATWTYLPDRPADASWLSQDERSALQTAIEDEERSVGGEAKPTWRDAFRNGPILVVGLMYSGINLSLTTAAFWLPQVIRSTGLTPWQVGIATFIPFALGAVAMLFWGRASDRRGERFVHTILPALLASLGWALAAFAQGPLTMVAAVSLATIGHFSASAVLWTFPSRFLRGPAAAVGVAMVSAIANIAAAFGPPIIGAIRDASGGWRFALLFVSAYLLITPLFVLVLKRMVKAAAV